MRTWHTLESGYERMQLIVGMALCLAMGSACLGLAALLAWMWIILWHAVR